VRDFDVIAWNSIGRISLQKMFSGKEIYLKCYIS